MKRWSSRWCTLLALLGISAAEAGAAEPTASKTDKPWLDHPHCPRGWPDQHRGHREW